MAKKASSGPNVNGLSANLGFERELWRAADALRGNMDVAEYKHVVLGLIFLKYISDAFEEHHTQLEADRKKVWAIAMGGGYSMVLGMDIAYTDSGNDFGLSLKAGRYRTRWYDPAKGIWGDQGARIFLAGDTTLPRPDSIRSEAVVYLEASPRRRPSTGASG